MSLNWPNDLKISCKSLFSLANFIESDLKLEENLEEFEKAFKRDKVVVFRILNIYISKFPCILKLFFK